VRIAYFSPVILLRSISGAIRKNFIRSRFTFSAGLFYRISPSLALRAGRPRSIYTLAI
jgi:hypothetical protein